MSSDSSGTGWQRCRRRYGATLPSYAEQLGIAAQHWDNAFRVALEDGAASGRFGAIRFEDFLRDPEASVRAICATVELPYRPELIPRPGDRLPFATLPTDTKWYPIREASHRTVSQEEADIIEARCGELAERLGYGPGAEFAPAAPGLLITS